jgi:hypothetical protein
MALPSLFSPRNAAKVHMTHVGMCNYLNDAASYIRSEARPFQTVLTFLRYTLGYMTHCKGPQRMGIQWPTEFPDEFEEGSFLERVTHEFESLTRLMFSSDYHDEKMLILLRRARFAAYYMHVLGYSYETSLRFYNEWCELYEKAKQNRIFHRKAYYLNGNRRKFPKIGEYPVVVDDDIDPPSPNQSSNFLVFYGFSYWMLWGYVLVHIETKMYSRLIRAVIRLTGDEVFIGEYQHFPLDEYKFDILGMFTVKHEFPIDYHEDGDHSMTWETHLNWIDLMDSDLIIKNELRPELKNVKVSDNSAKEKGFGIRRN